MGLAMVVVTRAYRLREWLQGELQPYEVADMVMKID